MICQSSPGHHVFMELWVNVKKWLFDCQQSWCIDQTVHPRDPIRAHQVHGLQCTRTPEPWTRRSCAPRVATITVIRAVHKRSGFEIHRPCRVSTRLAVIRRCVEWKSSNQTEGLFAALLDLIKNITDKLRVVWLSFFVNQTSQSLWEQPICSFNGTLSYLFIKRFASGIDSILELGFVHQKSHAFDEVWRSIDKEP